MLPVMGGAIGHYWAVLWAWQLLFNNTTKLKTETSWCFSTSFLFRLVMVFMHIKVEGSA